MGSPWQEQFSPGWRLCGCSVSEEGRPVTEYLELKTITPDGVDAAVARAEHYRLLNQPAQARSICHDILAVDPDNQRALVALVLATTDDFATGATSVNEAKGYVGRLADEYQRLYYSGLIAERQALAQLTKGPSAVFAHDGFREAMEWYEKAAEIRPEGNDDAILRWNACVRAIKDGNLRPRHQEAELGLE
jgi:tetratricopeptide (TPR) repeat protein